MAESIQHKLSRVRPPRVHVTYDVEIGGAIEKKELPFVVGVVADLAAQSEKEKPFLKERRFVEIDRDNFDAVMTSLSPQLKFSVPKILSFQQETLEAVALGTEGAHDVVTLDSGEKEGQEEKKPAEGDKKAGSDKKSASTEGNKEKEERLSVDLVFENFQDFTPFSVVKQIPLLNEAYEIRVRLNDLVARSDGNDKLAQQLEQLIDDQAVASKIEAESKGTTTTETDKILEDGNVLSKLSDEEKPYVRSLVQTFAAELAKVKEKPAGDLYFFILQRVAFLDMQISKQLDEILHHPDFQRLEGSWRGLHYLVSKTETGTRLKLRFLQASWKELQADLQRAPEFDQSKLFKKIYEDEYGTFGGAPYSCFVLDFPITRNPLDLDVFSKFVGIAAAAHAPVLAAASPQLFGMESFRDIPSPRDLAKVFESSEFVKWNSFRTNPDARYATLLLPRVLMRPPYGAESWPIDEFGYEESVDGETNEKFCWGSPAYVMAERITAAFAKYSWVAAIRGVEGGGLVEDLPVYTFKTRHGDADLKCPTEVIITDRREKELSDLGFLTLCHCKGTDYAAFFGAQTSQKPKVYSTDEANANALVSARLPYMLNASRFAHYIKAIMRDKIGSFMERGDVEVFLQNWLADYVLLSDSASQEAKSKYPLREGKVIVKEEPGKPGHYRAVLFLRPHFQLEELTVSMRLVAKLPQPAG